MPPQDDPDERITKEAANEDQDSLRPVWGIMESETAKFRLKEEELNEWEMDLTRREKEFKDLGGEIPPLPSFPAIFEGTENIDFDESTSIWDIMQIKAMRYAKRELGLRMREDVLERGIEGIG